MSGGKFEYIMAIMVSNDETTIMSGYDTSSNSGYTGKVYDSGNYTAYTGIDYPNSKYYDKYSFSTGQYSRIRSKLGDGVKEVYKSTTYGWYNDNSSFVYSNFPLFERGGYYYSGANAGVFCSVSYSGGDDTNRSSRLIITP